ncbi:hypothetical protein TheetDRAFT_3134 [Thermoanaerobacter ethanolicus JW 200]|nr:hypothetical protein TheetDRAFT_3134 [Thermoanaerobacter ethanolicus JW 200]
MNIKYPLISIGVPNTRGVFMKIELSDILKKMGVIVEISDDEMIVTLKNPFSSWDNVDIHEFFKYTGRRSS